MADWPTGYQMPKIETTAMGDSWPSPYAMGANHTKGAWATMLDPTTFNAKAILVSVIGMDTLAHDILFDIAIGAAGSEQIILANLHNWSGGGNVTRGARNWWFPLAVKAGSRIAIRGQSNNANPRNLYCSVHLFSDGFVEPYAGVETYGADSSGDSNFSLEIDPGGVANTKGAWGQLVAATGKHIRGLILHLHNTTESTASANWRVDIGVGGAGSEQVIIGDVNVCVGATVGQATENILPLIPVSIPAGTRIAARCQSGLTTAGHRLMQVGAHGLY